MELKIIKTKKQYQEYLNWVDELFDKKVKLNTPEGDKLQVALLLIKDYEDLNYRVPLKQLTKKNKTKAVVRDFFIKIFPSLLFHPFST